MRSAGAIGAGVLGLVMLGVAGCASVPDSSPLERAPLEQEWAQDDLAVPVPRRPEPGDDENKIVTGFVYAMASEQEGHKIARTYLSAGSRDSWQPEGLTVIDRIQAPTPGEEEGEVIFTAEKVGRILPDGSWQPAEGRFKLTFHLVTEGGQWRIEDPPNTRLLSRIEFHRGFEAYDLHFYSRDAPVLVPDPVYLRTGTGIETRLVNALLDGPSEWLAPSVRSAIGKDLELAAPSVVVEENVATIDFTTELLDVKDSARQRVTTQLAWTLKQVGVERVRLTVNDRTIRVGGAEESVATEEFDPALSAAIRQPYAIHDGEIHAVTMATGLVPVGWMDDAKDLSPREVAVGLLPRDHGSVTGTLDGSGRADQMALISGDGTQLWIYPDDAPPGEPAFVGTDLVGMSWDRSGNLWFVDRVSSGSRLYTVTADGELIGVHAPDLADADVRGMSISRDGVRAAVLLGAGRETLIGIGRVSRGDEFAIEEVRPLPVPLVQVDDLAWSDATELLVLGTPDESETQLLRVSIDSSDVTEVIVPTDATMLAAAPGEPILLAGSEDNRLYAHDPGRESSWRQLPEGYAPAYPG